MSFQTRTTIDRMRTPLPHDTLSKSYQRRGFVVPRGNIPRCDDTLAICDAEVHQAWLIYTQQVCRGRLIPHHLGDTSVLGILVESCNSIQHCLLQNTSGEALGLGVGKLRIRDHVLDLLNVKDETLKNIPSTVVMQKRTRSLENIIMI